MSNDKQTSLDWFLDELLQCGYIKRLPVTELQQAKAMHKEEIDNAYLEGFNAGADGFHFEDDYYNKTFNTEEKTPMQEFTKTEHYSLLNSEVEPGVGIEVFRVWNTYHSLPKHKKIEMLETLMSWSTEELKWTQLSIDSTSNADMNIGVQPFNTKEK